MVKLDVIKAKAKLALKWVQDKYEQNGKVVITALLVGGSMFFTSIKAHATDIVPDVGTLSSGGTAVAAFAGDAKTLLEFAAQAGIALTVVSVIIAVGWKAYRFFKPAR